MAISPEAAHRLQRKYTDPNRKPVVFCEKGPAREREFRGRVFTVGESDVKVIEQYSGAIEEWYWDCVDCSAGFQGEAPANWRCYHPIDMVRHLIRRHRLEGDHVGDYTLKALAAQALYLEGFEGVWAR